MSLNENLRKIDEICEFCHAQANWKKAVEDIETYVAYKTCVDKMFDDDIFTRERQMVLKLFTEEVINKMSNQQEKEHIVKHFVQLNEHCFH